MQALASVSGPLRARQARPPRAAAAARAGQGVAACHALMRTPQRHAKTLCARACSGRQARGGRTQQRRPRDQVAAQVLHHARLAQQQLLQRHALGLRHACGEAEGVRVSTSNQQSHSSYLHALGSGCGLLEGSLKPGPRPSFGARCRGQRCMGQLALPRKRVREHAHTSSSQTCHLGGRAPSSAVPPSCRPWCCRTQAHARLEYDCIGRWTAWARR
jgi:hypothetical protein